MPSDYEVAGNFESRHLDKHPLISSIELREAFNFGNIDEVKSFIEPLLQSNEFKIIEVPHGWFIEKVLEG